MHIELSALSHCFPQTAPLNLSFLLLSSAHCAWYRFTQESDLGLPGGAFLSFLWQVALLGCIAFLSDVSVILKSCCGCDCIPVCKGSAAPLNIAQQMYPHLTSAWAGTTTLYPAPWHHVKWGEMSKGWEQLTFTPDFVANCVTLNESLYLCDLKFFHLQNQGWIICWVPFQI